MKTEINQLPTFQQRLQPAKRDCSESVMRLISSANPEKIDWYQTSWSRTQNLKPVPSVGRDNLPRLKAMIEEREKALLPLGSDTEGQRKIRFVLEALSFQAQGKQNAADEIIEARDRIYITVLKDIPFDILDSVIVDLVRRSPYFPKPSDILGGIKNKDESDYVVVGAETKLYARTSEINKLRQLYDATERSAEKGRAI